MSSSSRRFGIVFFLFLGLSLYSNNVYAQIPDICEGSVPRNWNSKNSILSITPDRFKTGKESVLWAWKAPDAFIQIKDTTFQSVSNEPRSTFVIWIYNENPIKDKLRFEFKKDDTTASSFTFNLNFKGWRTAWIMYHRDMEGEPIDGMSELIIHAPSSVKHGSLYFDQVIYNSIISPRSPMRDEQVPFVNMKANEAANAHWTALYWFSHNPHYLALPTEVKAHYKNDLNKVLSRFIDLSISKPKYKKIKLADLEKGYDFWDIRRQKNSITGRPVYSVNDVELFRGEVNKAVKDDFKKYTITAYSELMLNIAGAYFVSGIMAEKKHLSRMFIDLADHLDDQGWSAGSGLGALHHLGYNFRDYYLACLLMKPALKEHNILNRTWETMHWFSGLGRTQVKPENIDDSNIDVFNTLLGSMLSTVLIMDDSLEKIRQMQEFSNWFSQSLMPTYSIDRTFKPDGSVVHHGNLYPAYGVGGFQGITPIMYSLSQTSFSVQPEAQHELKNVLLKMHYYTNPLKWPISVSGRHPTGNWKIPAEAYGYMALAGTPDRKEDIDRQMAAIYRKINTNQKDDWEIKFEGLGIESAPYAHGHWNINYGLLDIHRRSDWLLTVRGHNRYFTTHEAYPGANVFGRYLSYGFLEVTYPQTAQDDGSSFADKGWDWNNIPGTTTLHVPLDKLRARILNVDNFSGVEEMLLSDEIFAGGTNINQWQGMFAMKLHGHDKYNMESFRANKSWFMFDDLVICLGSDISNSVKEYATHTTLFQNSLKSRKSDFYLNADKVFSWPFEKKWIYTKELAVIDNRNIGYYLPGQKSVLFTKREQISRDQKDSEETKGDVAMLLIDHGVAPENDSYEYALKIQTDAASMTRFKNEMQSTIPVYNVLQKDSLAHTVFYTPEKITASALFHKNALSKDSVVLSNNRPCLMMYQTKKDTIKMSVTDPDLAFYTGPDDSPVNEKGERQEVSIYSRSWYRTPAQPSMVVLVIKGWWKMSAVGSRVKATRLSAGRTQLAIPCEYGLASKFELVRVDK